MITLEQVQALETRIDKALAAIDRLTTENASLRDAAVREKKRASDLERTIEEYRKDQTRIEQGILHALERLNAFEDAMQDAAPMPKPKQAAPGPAAPASGGKASSDGPSATEPGSSAKDGSAPESGAEEAELEIF